MVLIISIINAGNCTTNWKKTITNTKIQSTFTRHSWNKLKTKSTKKAKLLLIFLVLTNPAGQEVLILNRDIHSQELLKRSKNHRCLKLVHKTQITINKLINRKRRNFLIRINSK